MFRYIYFWARDKLKQPFASPRSYLVISRFTSFPREVWWETGGKLDIFHSKQDNDEPHRNIANTMYAAHYVRSGFSLSSGFPSSQLSLSVACCMLLGGGAVLGEWFVLTVWVSQVVI